MANFKTKILKHNNKILNDLNPKIQEKPAIARKKNAFKITTAQKEI